ncbi:MAG: hypothetical protein H6607_10365 [Flavobacteriales bacterium]|nr:hypothetical protein [Flavobacteriales bacterium]
MKTPILFLAFLHCSLRLFSQTNTKPSLCHYTIDDIGYLALRDFEPNSTVRAFSKPTGGEFIFSEIVDHRGSKQIKINQNEVIPAFVLNTTNKAIFKQPNSFSAYKFPSQKYDSYGKIGLNVINHRKENLVISFSESIDGINYFRTKVDSIFGNESRISTCNTQKNVEQIWIKYTLTTGSGILLYESETTRFDFEEFQVFPTLPNDFVKITSKYFQHNLPVVIKNSSGQEVKSFDFFGKEYDLFVNDLPKGTYFVHVPSKEWVDTRIFIIN